MLNNVCYVPYLGEDGQSVLLVSLPVFSETGTAAMLNLRDMSCQPLILNSNLQQDNIGGTVEESSEEMEH